MEYEEIVHQFQSNIFGTLTTIRSQKDKNLIWFIGMEVQDLLGHTNITKAIKDAKLKANEIFILSKTINPQFWTDFVTNQQLGAKVRQVTFISESGLYKLIMRSNKPEAENFQHWIASEVLPTLRVAVERDLKINYKMNDVALHLDIEYQKFQSKKINYINIRNGGVRSAIDYNRDSCKAHSGKTPKQLKLIAKKAGWPSIDRTSGKTILRKTNPEIAASMSFTDDMTSGGVPYNTAFKISNGAAKELFKQMIEAGITPNELTR